MSGSKPTRTKLTPTKVLSGEEGSSIASAVRGIDVELLLVLLLLLLLPSSFSSASAVSRAEEDRGSRERVVEMEGSE